MALRGEQLEASLWACEMISSLSVSLQHIAEILDMFHILKNRLELCGQSLQQPFLFLTCQ